jgi:hypothetical protein
MILYYQTHSPFARKALVFAYEVGIADRLEVIHHETSPILRNARVYAENPLGKQPASIAWFPGCMGQGALQIRGPFCASTTISGQPMSLRNSIGKDRRARSLR